MSSFRKRKGHEKGRPPKLRLPTTRTPPTWPPSLSSPCLPSSVLTKLCAPSVLLQQLFASHARYAHSAPILYHSLPDEAEQHPRTFATFPDPTHPTNSQDDVPNLKPRENNNTRLWIAGGLAAAAAGGSYYYYYYVDQGPVDPHAQLKAEEERLKQKAEELRNGGKATAHDAARDCQSKYEETKVRRALRAVPLRVS